MTFRAHIQTIRHQHQRYDTVGDWRWIEIADKSDPLAQTPALRIDVSALGDWRYEALVAVHELIECILCRLYGITDEAVTAFDKEYAGDGEPGADIRAPYHRQHMFATRVEEMLAAELGVDWTEYESAIERVSE